MSGCCVVDSLDDEEPMTPSTSIQPQASSAMSQDHTERHEGGLPTPSEDWNESDLRRAVLDNECQCTVDPSSLTTCNDEDETVERLQQQKRQRRFRRRHRRAFVGGQTSSNSLDELQHQYRPRPRLVQSSASLVSAPSGSEVAAAGYCRKDAWNWTRVGYQSMPPGNSAVVDPLPLQNGRSWRETTAAAGAPTRTARFTVPTPVIDGGLRSQDSALHAAKPLPLTTTWLANRVQTTIARRPPRHARDAWSKSQEIHPKTSASGSGSGGSGGVASLRGSSSVTLIPVRRRSSLHAVFVDDTRTAVLKDVVIPMPSYHT